MIEIEKIIIITQKTALDELVDKYNTKEQAKFYILHMGGDFNDYFSFHRKYYESLSLLKRSIPSNIRYQVVDRSFLPNFLFGDNDLVIVLGRDGLIINTAKYLNNQVILGVNPDKSRIDGVLLPFEVKNIKDEINKIQNDDTDIIKISIAHAVLNNNQSLLGVNDIFIGQRTHQSARYSITFNGIKERHSSSGIIISTGVGSTGWFKSVIAGAYGIVKSVSNIKSFIYKDYSFPWDANYLYFCVREPWKSKTTGNSIVFGQINKNNKLIIESYMPDNGVIFSDGIENDSINFNSGSIVEIGLAEKKVNLIVK